MTSGEIQAPQPEYTVLATGTGPRGRASVNSMPFSPDGRSLLAGRSDLSVQLWKLSSIKRDRDSRPALEVTHKQRVTSVGFSPTGISFVAGDSGGEIGVYETSTGRRLHRLSFQENPVNCLQFMQDETLIASAHRRGTVCLWDLKTGNLKWRGVDFLQIHSFTCLAVGRDQAVIITGREDGQVTLWNTTSGKPVRSFNASLRRIESLVTSPVADVFAVASDNGRTVHLYNYAGRSLGSFGAHFAGVSALAFSRDGRCLACGGLDPDVKVWDVASGRCRLDLRAREPVIRAVAFSPDGKLLAVGNNDGAIQLWDLTCTAKDAAKDSVKPGDLPALWAVLGRGDARAAHVAIWKLVAAGEESVALIRKEAKAVAGKSTRDIEDLVASLNDDSFAVRERTQRELESLAELAEPALRRTAAKGLAPEAARRVDQLLAKLNGSVQDARTLQLLWAIEVLERIGSKEARAVLQELAKGAEGAYPTREAKSALARLALP